MATADIAVSLLLGRTEDKKVKITEEQLDAIKAHALECYPQECCGLIIDGIYKPEKNISKTPTETFRIKPSVYAAATLSNKLECVVHSHCYALTDKLSYDPRWASTPDMQRWITTAIPWAIVACNGEDVSDALVYDDNDIQPLLGRTFVHGLTDCYSIIRDYYRTILNIQLINGARGMDWWNNGENLYEDNFAKAGFYEITATEADINDLCLFQVRSPVINHAAVITGNNEITHHLFHRLSERDRLDRWRTTIVKYLRYNATLNTLIQDHINVKSDNTSRSTS